MCVVHCEALPFLAHLDCNASASSGSVCESLYRRDGGRVPTGLGLPVPGQPKLQGQLHAHTCCDAHGRPGSHSRG